MIGDGEIRRLIDADCLIRAVDGNECDENDVERFYFEELLREHPPLKRKARQPWRHQHAVTWADPIPVPLDFSMAPIGHAADGSPDEASLFLAALPSEERALRRQARLREALSQHTCAAGLKAQNCKPCASARRALELKPRTSQMAAANNSSLDKTGRRILTERDRLRARAKIAALREAGVLRLIMQCPVGHAWATSIETSTESGVESPLCLTCGAYFWRWKRAAVKHDRLALIRLVHKIRTSPPWLILAMQRVSVSPNFAALINAARRDIALANAALPYRHSTAYRTLGMRILTLPIAAQRLVSPTTVRPGRTIVGELALSTSREE
jgi:hypothetical protein